MDPLTLGDEELLKKFEEPASFLFACQVIAADRVRELTIEAYGQLRRAHQLIVGVLGAALILIDGKITPVTTIQSQRGALFASFVIGLEVCEEAIITGRYLQAMALVRQEVETLAQLEAISAGRHNPKRSPNIALIEPSVGRLYGDLSAGAHLSRHHLNESMTETDVIREDLPGSTSGTRYYPDFNADLARGLFCTHLILIARVIEALSVDLSERFGPGQFDESHLAALDLAIRILAAEGC